MLIRKKDIPKIKHELVNKIRKAMSAADQLKC